ncbi:glutathione S-transferase [Rivularia sp. IAM M-261]|nr:glutathione S-transferase [Rivularia sp. IAM M-261]
MLKFYYNKRSPMARRVWRGLLEKQIEFEPIVVNLNGDQMAPEYLELNPFHHVPVIVDDGFRVIESLAILDYLEAKYPAPALLPNEPQQRATVKMVQLVSSNELLPKAISFIFKEADSPIYIQAKQHIHTVFQFFTTTLGENVYFGGDTLSLADIVAGTDIYLLAKSGFNLSEYPKLNDWYKRLMEREVWQNTELNTEEFEQFKRVFLIIQTRKIRQTRRT